MHTRRFRGAVVVLVVAFLEVLVFRGYLTGQTIPPWDFLGGYNTDAFLWWSEGSFFDPIDWVPNTWAGHPAALSLQNSAWYLPVGMASIFGPFTLHSAAVLAAVHVAFGAIGTYLLVRSFKQSFPVALVAMVAAFFAVGYYSNAEHVDFNRGYALLPWVLLILSPAWPWMRWWSVPLGALILWQALTGVYPGMLVAMVYAGAVWVVVHQVVARPRLREYLLPAAISFLIAVLLSAPRLLPYYFLSADAAAGLVEQSEFSFDMIGTLLYGYGSSDLHGNDPAGLPNDISMRSFFIPATVLVLAFFARWRDGITKLATALLAPSVVLGMPSLPWFDLAQGLPGLGLSRFTMSDFKMIFVLGVVLLACSGLSSLIALSATPRMPKEFWWRLVALLLFGVLMGFIAVTGPYARIDWFPGYLLLGLVGATILAYLVLRSRTNATVILSFTLVALTAGSGLVWAFSNTMPWMHNRVDAEVETYGHTVDELLAQRVESSALVQRPARIGLGDDLSATAMYSARWNGAYYLGVDSVGGYVNFKGSETHMRLQSALTDPGMGPGFAAFLAAPGAVLTDADRSVSPLAFRECAENQANCGVAEITPVSYEPGSFVYRVESPRAAIGYMNESYFDGWSAQICKDGGVCAAAPVERSQFGVIQTALPAGSYTLKVEYATAGRSEGWVLFWVGVVASAASTLLRWRPGRKEKYVRD